jgi:hypothetical protein
VQLFLGVAAYLTRLASPGDPQPLNPMVGITVAHVACGALVFVSTIVLTLRAYRVFRIHEMNPANLVNPEILSKSEFSERPA